MSTLRPGVLSALAVFGLFLVFLYISPASAAEADSPVAGGHFYTQADGDTPDPDDGFAIVGTAYDAFIARGGVAVWGYPVARPFIDDVGRTVWLTQAGGFQVSADGTVEFLNVFDAVPDSYLSAKGLPITLAGAWDSDVGRTWEQVIDNHLAILDP